MILFRCNLIFGAVKSIIVSVFKIVYKILSFFNLQFALFVLIVGALLYVTGIFDSSPAALMVFYFAVVISVIAGVIYTLKKLLAGDGVKKSKGVQMVSNATENDVDVHGDGKDETAEESLKTYSQDSQNNNNNLSNQSNRTNVNSESQTSQSPAYFRPDSRSQIYNSSDALYRTSEQIYGDSDNGEYDRRGGYGINRAAENYSENPLRPRVYAIKGHPSYFMAEYADRYELYKKSAAGLEKVRTDYKTFR